MRLLGLSQDWISKSFPALGNRTVIEAYEAREYEAIIRVFAHTADYLGNTDPFLFNFTKEERRSLGLSSAPRRIPLPPREGRNALSRSRISNSS
jgi:hypothetical protein